MRFTLGSDLSPWGLTSGHYHSGASGNGVRNPSSKPPPQLAAATRSGEEFG